MAGDERRCAPARVAKATVRKPGPCASAAPFVINSSYATLRCRSPIETSPASPIEMSRSSVCLRLVRVAWDDGDHDEPQGADAPAGADRYCRRTAIGCGRHGAARSWTKTGLTAAGCISSSRCDFSRHGRTSIRPSTRRPPTGSVAEEVWITGSSQVMTMSDTDQQHSGDRPWVKDRSAVRRNELVAEP